ncbi:MAG: T9SS type A sorting domain-containing protein, partial [Sphingomonadales bacterium]
DYNPQISQHGCVNVGGTPLLAGSYTIDVTVLADLTILSGYPFVFQIHMDILPSTASISNNGYTITGAPSCAPALVSFTNNNPGLAQYAWNFGNGNVSYAENPSPQYYANPGTYVVSYTAFANLDTTHIYTLTNLYISSMSNFGGGFPSYENADAYFKLFENGQLYYQSTIIGDQNPPVQWSLNLNLNPNNTYVFEIWEADDSYGEPYFGADDYMGSHNLNLNGCNGCGAGTSNFNYSINHQVILPTPQVLASDTIVVYGLPVAPVITYDSLSHTLSSPDLGLSYQWYFNGSPLAGATTATHVVYQSGSYYLVAINPNGCVAFSDTLLAIYCSPFIQPQLNVANNILSVSNIPQDAQINWYLNNTLVPNQNNNTLGVSQNGNYQCQITDAFGCQYQSNLLLIDVGLQSVLLNAPKVYPNPTHGLVEVQLDPQWLGAHYILSDLQGQMIAQNVLFDTENQIDMQHLANGVYILTIENQQQEYRLRIIKN